MIKVALCPPNPNELDITCCGRTARGRVWNVVQVALRVRSLVIDRGRQNAFIQTRAQMTASKEPDAPNKWPVIDFVDEIGTR